MSPCGSAMRVDIAAGVDADGRITQWRTALWSATHGQRPDWDGDINLLPDWFSRGASAVEARADVAPALGHGAERNGTRCLTI
jgi:hypothetical protein